VVPVNYRYIFVIQKMGLNVEIPLEAAPAPSGSWNPGGRRRCNILYFPDIAITGFQPHQSAGDHVFPRLPAKTDDGGIFFYYNYFNCIPGDNRGGLLNTGISIAY
jgi:hypothetical protein